MSSNLLPRAPIQMTPSGLLMVKVICVDESQLDFSMRDVGCLDFSKTEEAVA